MEQYIPKKDDLVDVEFITSKGKRWACGKVTKVDRYNKKKVYIEFEDSHKYSKFDRNDDWFDLASEKDLKIRRCEEKNGHKRSDKPSILSIQEANYKERKRRKDKMHRKERKMTCEKEASGGRLGSHATCQEGNAVTKGVMNLNSRKVKLTDSMPLLQNATLLTDKRAKKKEGSIVLPVRGSQIAVRGDAEFLIEFLGKLSAV